jgi:hypothetical protein
MNFLLQLKRVRVAYRPDGSRAGPIGAVRFLSESAACDLALGAIVAATDGSGRYTGGRRPGR